MVRPSPRPGWPSAPRASNAAATAAAATRTPNMTSRERKEANSRLLRAEVAAGALVHEALPEVLVLNHSDLCSLRCVMCPSHLAQGTHRLDARVLERLCDRL
jgi:hypothetical protein